MLALLPLVACLLAPPTPTVLLRDDFDGDHLDNAVWQLASWSLGRSRLGEDVAVADGHAVLAFNTFDPDSPGERTVGSELFTKQAFARPADGVLEIEARVRLGDDLPPGIVASIFTYATVQSDAGPVSDEIDFEFLTAQNANAKGRVTCTTWNDWNEKTPDYEDETVTSSETIAVGDLDLHAFNTYIIRWHADRVEWLVNGERIRVAETAVPDAPSPIRFNLWAAAEGWTDAYAATLQPAASAEDNKRSTYAIDYVEVRAVPDVK